jgi:hypothetical protein
MRRLNFAVTVFAVMAAGCKPAVPDTTGSAGGGTCLSCYLAY